MIDLPENIDLENPEFQQVFRLLRHTDANIFLTGKAGTGKSTFLRYICNNISKNSVVLAPTGVAAVNVGGMTIHSFFQMPLRPVPPDDPDYSVKAFKNSGKFSRSKRKLIKQLDLIVIDEVSMVRPDMIDFIDRALRGITGNRGKPFGGIQLLLVGDIFQLEPVVTPDTRLILSKYYPDYFFFNARAYADANLVSVELKKIYRQSDRTFIDMLDRVRLNATSHEDLEMFNSRMQTEQDNEPLEDFGITLTTRRDRASEINRERMNSLPGEEFVFKGVIEDDFPERSLPTDLNLTLKKDAQVMMIRNDKDRRWVNGTLAKITEITEKSIKIMLEDGKEESVEREIWDNITYTYDEKERKVKEEVLGTFTQYPLRAAWALTIHKSQGLTFGNVTIDMAEGAFTAGQTYVALSRCRTLDGIRFISPLRRGDVIVSRGAYDFSKNFNNREQAERVMRESQAEDLSRESIAYFKHDEFEKAAESLWEANRLTGILEKRSVRRLISSRISSLTRIKKEVEDLRQKLKDVAAEYVEMGEGFLSEGKIEESLKMYRRSLELESGNEAARIGAARCLMLKGENREALENLDEMIKRKGRKAFDAYLMKGEIYEKMGEYSQAALSYQGAAKKDKSSRRPIEHLKAMYEKIGMDEEAEKYKDRLSEM